MRAPEIRGQPSFSAVNCTGIGLETCAINFTRACRQLSQTTLATSWTAARKLRAVFSHGSGFAGPRTGYASGDRTELLDLGEEVLDQMAFAVKRSVIVSQ